MTDLFKNYPMLAPCAESINKAVELMETTYKNGGKILLCGNGGSCADCDHIVGELMKGFLSDRPIKSKFKEKLGELFPDDADYMANHLQEGISAISLNSHAAVLSAFANDVAADMVYAQMVYGYAKENDLLIGISTSGNSQNVVNAVKAAKAFGIKTVALTGERECMLDMADVTIKAPETETYRIQEYHLPIYHYICAELERRIFG